MDFKKLLRINEGNLSPKDQQEVTNIGNNIVKNISPEGIKTLAMDQNEAKLKGAVDTVVNGIGGSQEKKDAIASNVSTQIKAKNEIDANGQKASLSPEEVDKGLKTNGIDDNTRKNLVNLVKNITEHSINKEYAKQRRITEDQINKKCSAAVLFIDLDTLKVLGVHSTNEWPRRMHRDDGDWQLPKGEIEYGENPVMTAIREMNEELGVDITPIVENGLLHHFGIVPYIQTKDLDLYWISVKESTLVHMAETCSCKSYFTNRNGIEQPEVDDYKVCSIYELTEATQRALSSFVATIMS